jgi:hypothetical protein
MNSNNLDFQSLAGTGLQAMQQMLALTKRPPFFFSWNGAGIDNIYLVQGYARIVVEAYSRMSKKDKMDLKTGLECTGPFIEPSILEGMAPEIDAQKIVVDRWMANTDDEQFRKKGKLKYDTALLELLLIAHDVEYFIRPHLLRLLWLAQKSVGKGKSYRESQQNERGGNGSIGYAIDRLDIWTKQCGGSILRRRESKAFEDLIAEMKSLEGSNISVENLRNWVNHRDFIITEIFVIFNIDPIKGKRLRISRNQLVRLKFLVNSFCFLLVTLEEMLIHYISEKEGEIQPHVVTMQALEVASNKVNGLRRLNFVYSPDEEIDTVK